VDEGEDENEDDDLTSGTGGTGGGLDMTGGGTSVGTGVGGALGSGPATTSGSSNQNHSGHVSRPSETHIDASSTPISNEPSRLSRTAISPEQQLPSLPGEHLPAHPAGSEANHHQPNFK
jgi:hypothetical protein